jgi:hypothetical protein
MPYNIESRGEVSAINFLTHFLKKTIANHPEIFFHGAPRKIKKETRIPQLPKQYDVMLSPIFPSKTFFPYL